MNRFTEGTKNHVAVQHRVLREGSSMNSGVKILTKSWASELLANTDIDGSHLWTLNIH